MNQAWFTALGNLQSAGGRRVTLRQRFKVHCGKQYDGVMGGVTGIQRRASTLSGMEGGQ